MVLVRDYYEWWSNNDGWTDILVSGPLCRDTAFSESLTGLGSTRGICIGRQTARYDYQYSMGSRDYYYNDWKGDVVVCNCALAEIASDTWFNCRYESGINTIDFWWSYDYDWFFWFSSLQTI